MLFSFYVAKKSRVYNFEPHSIIKKCFKNNRFINLLPDRVKNYEPNPKILAFNIVYEKKATGAFIIINT
jgi:hypothetical protein